jgi:hypothetical protein
LFESDELIRKAWQITEAYPDVMRTEPVSGVADDSYEAAKQITALVEQQRALAPTLTTSQLYERVYADPGNKALLAPAHSRPTASSTSGDELQR